MELKIQDPSYTDSSYLLEEMLDVCKGARAGAGTYAFASPGGIRLLLHHEFFEDFLKRGQFELIVGVDAVTNVVALNDLTSRMGSYPSLNARVLLDQSRASGLFHPKFAWFTSETSAVWFVGSNNLTAGGLRGNVESYVIQRLSLAEHALLEQKWRLWLEFHRGNLVAPNDPVALDKASSNTGRELVEAGAKGLVPELLVEKPEGEVIVNALKRPDAAVLVAEIPKGKDRWKQANFSVEVFKNFFGAVPGKTQHILLTQVRADGSVEEEKVRPSVSVKSHNYRFELGAASNLPYPDPPLRPIAVFLRAGTRTFRYQLLMPGEVDYDLVNRLLQGRTTVKAGRMRRYETDVLDLTAIWPDAPVLRS